MLPACPNRGYRQAPEHRSGQSIARRPEPQESYRHRGRARSPWSPATLPAHRCSPTGARGRAPEALTVVTLPEHHGKPMRNANPIERAVQPGLERRTVEVRRFPDNHALLRLVTAALIDIDNAPPPVLPRLRQSISTR